MTLRDHRTKAKQWSYGRAQLTAASPHYGKRRTKLSAKRVKASERQQQKGANDGHDDDRSGK